MKLKIIFDKDKISDKYSSGWGISYIIDDRVLFDVGEKGEYILNNIRVLGIDIGEIEKIVISHNQWDHIGGLWDLLNINRNIEVFACSDFFEEFKDKISGYNFTLVDGSCEIAKNIYTSGCLQARYKGSNLKEQFVLVRTEKGISVICGCSHSGILEFLKKAKEIFPKPEIYSLLGGFHLMDKDKRFIRYVAEGIKKEGVVNVGPSHCAGFQAVSIFKEFYSENFLDIKVGAEIEL